MSDNEPCAQRKSGQRVGRQLTGAWQDTIFLPLLKGRQRIDTAAFAMRRSEQGTARSPAMPFAKQGDKPADMGCRIGTAIDKVPSSSRLGGGNVAARRREDSPRQRRRCLVGDRDDARMRGRK